MKIITVASQEVNLNSEESHVSGIYDYVNSTYGGVPDSSICQQVSVRQDRYVNIALATSSQTVMLLLFETGITRSKREVERGKKKSIFDSLLLKSLASLKHASLSFQPFTTHANTYIHSETHTLPTHMHTNPTPIHTGPL